MQQWRPHTILALQVFRSWHLVYIICKYIPYACVECIVFRPTISLLKSFQQWSYKNQRFVHNALPKTNLHFDSSRSSTQCIMIWILQQSIIFIDINDSISSGQSGRMFCIHMDTAYWMLKKDCRYMLLVDSILPLVLAIQSTYFNLADELRTIPQFILHLNTLSSVVK